MERKARELYEQASRLERAISFANADAWLEKDATRRNRLGNLLGQSKARVARRCSAWCRIAA